MKEKYSIELLVERMDAIEKLLKMLVVNSLVDGLNNTKDKESKEAIEKKCELPMELEVLLKEYGMSAISTEIKNSFIMVYIDTGNSAKYKVKDFHKLDCMIKDSFIGIIPVFRFSSLNGMQRKRFIEEDISFCIDEKEIHICARYD